MSNLKRTLVLALFSTCISMVSLGLTQDFDKNTPKRNSKPLNTSENSPKPTFPFGQAQRFIIPPNLPKPVFSDDDQINELDDL